MPTLPSEPPPPPPAGYRLHQDRGVAESFGTDAARYDRTRPSYPAGLISAVVATSPGISVLDVGSGTGIAARQFQAAGCTVLGVEPDGRMAEFGRRCGVPAEVATFEAWDPAGRSFDAVVAAQSWHWVDPVAGAAKAATVLRPDGVLALFWHVFQLPPEVLDALAAAFRQVAPDAPFRVKAMRRALDDSGALTGPAADGIRRSDMFGPPEQARFDWERDYTRDELLDQLPTSGGLTRLPPDRLAVVLEHVGAAVDALGGGFTMPYATFLVSATRAA